MLSTAPRDSWLGCDPEEGGGVLGLLHELCVVDYYIGVWFESRRDLWAEEERCFLNPLEFSGVCLLLVGGLPCT